MMSKKEVIRGVIMGLCFTWCLNAIHKLGWIQGQIDADVETINIGRHITITKSKDMK